MKLIIPNNITLHIALIVLITQTFLSLIASPHIRVALLSTINGFLSTTAESTKITSILADYLVCAFQYCLDEGFESDLLCGALA